MSKFQPFHDLPAAGEHVVYVFHGDGYPVYVGRSSDLAARVKAHRQAEWFPLAKTLTWERFDSLADASRAERETIRAIVPLANWAHQDRDAHYKRTRSVLADVLAKSVGPAGAERYLAAAEAVVA